MNIQKSRHNKFMFREDDKKVNRNDGSSNQILSTFVSTTVYVFTAAFLLCICDNRVAFCRSIGIPSKIYYNVE